MKHTLLNRLSALKVTKQTISLLDNLFQSYPIETWSGSGKEGQHHYGTGGLFQHSFEVMELMLANFEVFSRTSTIPLNVSIDEIVLAAWFHDAGKTFDYVQDSSGVWVGTPHKRLIHHITRSVLIWNEIATVQKVNADLKDRLIHSIAAHHGSREFGSPVAPATQLAWLLHLSDSISARLTDCNTLDYLKHRTTI